MYFKYVYGLLLNKNKIGKAAEYFFTLRDCM